MLMICGKPNIKHYTGFVDLWDTFKTDDPV